MEERGSRGGLRIDGRKEGGTKSEGDGSHGGGGQLRRGDAGEDGLLFSMELKEPSVGFGMVLDYHVVKGNGEGKGAGFVLILLTEELSVLNPIAHSAGEWREGLEYEFVVLEGIFEDIGEAGIPLNLEAGLGEKSLASLGMAGSGGFGKGRGNEHNRRSTANSNDGDDDEHFYQGETPGFGCGVEMVHGWFP
jgi:hypothetical protein